MLLRYIFILIVFIHGMIHLMGFAKALSDGAVKQIAKAVSIPVGILWLLTALLFFICTWQLVVKKEWWWISGLVAVICSQVLVFTNWHDAKYGTIANLLILSLVTIGYFTWSFSNSFKKEVEAALMKTTSMPDTILTEKDIQDIPEVVKKYIRYTGSVGKPKVVNFKVNFKGQIRKDEHADWMPFTSIQYNFPASSTRLFFIRATMKKLPVAGFHCFKNGIAFMDIRLLSLIKVQYQSGIEMGIAETVTFFNDMCCMAPATLIDKRIKWLESDSTKAKASFTNNQVTITAWLYFDDSGALINFISDDRLAFLENQTMKKIQWSTPLKNYKTINGYKLGGTAETIYSYPEKDLTYGQFTLMHIGYNCKTYN